MQCVERTAQTIHEKNILAKPRFLHTIPKNVSECDCCSASPFSGIFIVGRTRFRSRSCLFSLLFFSLVYYKTHSHAMKSAFLSTATVALVVLACVALLSNLLPQTTNAAIIPSGSAHQANKLVVRRQTNATKPPSAGDATSGTGSVSNGNSGT